MSNMITVAYYTFLQLYKSKAMIAALIMSVGVLVLSFVATEISYGVAARVALDFGVGAASLCSMGLAIFLGMNIMSKEIEQRTLYMIITRPIGRGSFMAGKSLGVFAMIVVSIFLLMFSSLTPFKFYGGVINFHIFTAYLFILLESIIIHLFVVNLTLITNLNIALVFGLLMPVLGHTLTSTFQTSMIKKYPSLETFLDVSTFLLPDLDKINLRPYLLYEEALRTWPIMANFAYATVYILALSLLAIFIFRQKEIH